MKKPTFLVLALSLSTASPALAQHGDGGAPHRGRGAALERGMHGRGGHGHPGHGWGRHDPAERIERMRQELGLSPAQVEQLQRIFTESRTQREALRGHGPSPEGRLARHGLREQTRSRVDAVLTPAQRERATQLREQRHAQRANRRVEHMAARLGLRPEQATRVREIFERARQQHQALGRGPEQRETHRALRQRTMAEVDAVLDAEQRVRAQELRRGRRAHRGWR